MEKICKFCQCNYRQNNHQIFCKQNPERKERLNQFSKAKMEGTVFAMTDETRQKMSISHIGKTHNEETKAKISNSMREIVTKLPEKYSGRYNRGIVKRRTCTNGFVVLGSWEELFVEFCIDRHIRIEQPNVCFSYFYEKERQYYPDFYLPDVDIWIEIKGYQTEKDLKKWEYFRSVHKKNLLVLRKIDIMNLEEWSTKLDSNQRSIDYSH